MASCSVTLSARAYVEGELRWVGFRAASGLDRRTLLGMGVETDLEALTLAAADRLMAELEKALASPGGGGTLGRAGATEGRWALLPFTGLTSRSATANAETVTEAARAAALEQGISLLSPNRVSELLRQQRVVRWDQLTEDVRTSLLADGGAEVILTGSVEIYEAGGGPEPEPEVSVAMSLVDTATGNTLWSGALERRARDLERPFGLGRIFSHGALAQRLVTRLTNRLLREHGEAGRRGRLG